MAKDRFVDFDRFLAEREQQMTTVRIFGRDCRVPAELPWHYVLKLEAMRQGGTRMDGAEHLALLEQMFTPEDHAFITQHPEFRASLVMELIARTWLRAGEDAQEEKGPVFRTEDDVKVEETQAGASKKGGSAR